jgi:hypothetical protein
MAGEALTSKFMLGTATVMLGACADLLDLNTVHSLGLVKDITTKTSPGYTTLTQGVKNNQVASVQTANDVTIEGMMFEYTMKNLAYAAALDASALSAVTGSTTTTAALTTSGSPLRTPAVIPVTSATGIVAGGYISIRVNGADQIFVRKVVSVAALNVTVNQGVPVAVPSGAVVDIVNKIDVGSSADQPYLACKIVGQLADSTWVTQLYPKVRVQSGLSLAFKTGDFDNIPLTINPYTPTPTDPNYALFLNPDGSTARGQIYVNA